MKAQVAYTDFIVAIFIVAFMSSIFIFTLSNRSVNNDYLTQDAAHISEVILGKGSPDPWNVTTVKRPGVTNGGWRVDEQHLQELYKLDRTKLRALLDTEDNIYIQIYNESTLLNFSGKNFSGRLPSNPRTITSISRYAIFNNSIITIEIGVWR